MKLILLLFILISFSCKHEKINNHEKHKEISTKNTNNYKLPVSKNISTEIINDKMFQTFKLPISSADITFKTDSLGYYISNKKDYINVEKFGLKIEKNKSIIPIGKLKFQNYMIYIYGHGKIGEELLQPIITAKTFDNKNNIIDSLELQRFQSWDYELKRTFTFNIDNFIEIHEFIIAYPLENANEEGIKTSKKLKYLLNNNGKFQKK